jgi:hypothetical protein
VKWFIEETGMQGESTLILTVNKKEQCRLATYMCRNDNGRLDKFEPRFDSDDFLYDLLLPMFTDDCYSWLPEGVCGDLTSAPMVGILGSETPGPPANEAECSGLHNCGWWEINGQVCDIYQPVLHRWAFMNYAITSPQRELAEHGRCEWQGGEFWASQEKAEKAIAEYQARSMASG